MSTQLHHAVLSGVFSFLGGCCENFLWADTRSQERRMFKMVGWGMVGTDFSGPECEQADGDREGLVCYSREGQKRK